MRTALIDNLTLILLTRQISYKLISTILHIVDTRMADAKMHKGGMKGGQAVSYITDTNDQTVHVGRMMLYQ